MAKCSACKHTESDHRIQTHFDKLRMHHQKNAGTSACVGCTIECKGFGKPDDSISLDSPLSKQCTLCSHSIDNHRPKMETDDLILSAVRDNTSVHCQKMLETKNQPQGKIDGYDMHDWFEAVNVDPDERQDTSGSHNCYCRGFVIDDPARVCHVYYGLTKEIVQPHLLSINCQRCSHDLSEHRTLNEKEQIEKDIESECKLTLLTMSKKTISVTDGQEPVAMYTPDEDGPQMFCLARSVKNNNAKMTSLKISVISTSLPQTKIETVKEMKRKRTNSGKFLDAVKSKFKKRKLMNTSDATESDELRSDESLTCSESDSSFTKHKKKKKKLKQKSEELYDDASENQDTARKTTYKNSDEFAGDARHVEHVSTIVNSLMNTTQERVIELPKYDVKALAWGRFEGNSELLLAVGYQDGSVTVYSVTIDTVKELEKCNYNGNVSVTRLLWLTPLLLAVSHINGSVNIIKVTTDGMSEVCRLKNSKASKVTAVAASPTGSCVCVGQQDGSVSFFMINSDGSTPKLLSASSISYGAVQNLAWHPNKNIVIAAGEDDHVTVFYMETLADRKKDKTRGTIMHYLGKKNRFELDIFTKCCKLKGHLSFVGGVTFDPTGAFLISVGWDGQILFWDTTDIDDVISCGAGDVSTIECTTGYMIGQRKFRNFPSDGMNFMPVVVLLAKPIVYVLANTDSETQCLVAYQVPKKYR